MPPGYCLRSRWSIDETAVADAICGTRRWRRAPPSWSWSWPINQEITEKGKNASQNLAASTSTENQSVNIEGDVAGPDGSARNLSWLREVRAVAVTDGGNAIVFVSKKGKVFLANSSARSTLTPLVVDPHQYSPTSTNENSSSSPQKLYTLTNALVSPGSSASTNVESAFATQVDLFAFASSVACFQLVLPNSRRGVDIAAVGYDSGAVVLFDLTSQAPRFITRPVSGLPVRRLRFVTLFHLLDPLANSTEATQYPAPSVNSGLFCVFGWSGLAGRLPMTAIYDAVESRRNDMRGANWTLWKLSDQDLVIDATPCSSEPNSICEMDPDPAHGPLRIVAGGHNPPIAAYSCGDLPAFSARDAARMAAAAVWRIAGSAIYSRFMQGYRKPSGVSAEKEDKDDAKATRMSVRTSLTWDDDQTQSSSFGFQDIRLSARQSLSSILRRRRSSSHTSEPGAQPGLRGVEPSRIENAGHGISVSLGTIAPGSRIVQLCLSAPLPCSLFATCDSLGRILIMDARDLCVLHILKGYRDARVAWLARGGPALIAMAPRRSVLEVHDPVSSKRHAIFRIDPASLLVQSTIFGVFCFTSNGSLYELVQQRKPVIGVANSVAHESSNFGSSEKTPESEDAHDSSMADPVHQPSVELLQSFISFCKTGQAGFAVEMLDKASENGFKNVAYLMAALVCNSTFVRSEVHVAVAAGAARLAKASDLVDLEIRYEAHGRLGEAFGLFAPENLPSRITCPNHEARGALLQDDADIADMLHSFAGGPVANGSDPNMSSASLEHLEGSSSSGTVEKRISETFCCEHFILAHVIVPPDSEAALAQGYVLRPRDDLSAYERIWLSRAYFSRLIAREESDLTRGMGAEPSSTVDVFRALKQVLCYSAEQISWHFLDFFLWTPVEHLLSTPVSMMASALRCGLRRLRRGQNRASVDDMIIDSCENSTRIANALLLVRLCIVQEDRESSELLDERYFSLMKKLRQAVQLRIHLIGSKAESTVRGRITASHFEGNSGEADRQAVSLLGESGECSRAAAVVAGLAYRRPAPEWHEKLSVSEVALQVSRRLVAKSLDASSYDNLTPNLTRWIKDGMLDNSVPSQSSDDTNSAEVIHNQIAELKGVQLLLNAAHEYFPDTSVDSARCSQLLEGINVVIRRLSNSSKLQSSEGEDENHQGIESRVKQALNPLVDAEKSAEDDLNNGISGDDDGLVASSEEERPSQSA